MNPNVATLEEKFFKKNKKRDPTEPRTQTVGVRPPLPRLVDRRFSRLLKFALFEAV